MALFQGAILSPEEKNRIHQESLRLLAQVGVKITSDAPLKLLQAHGAPVDQDRKIAKIPAALVEHALASTPRILTLGARNPKYDFAMPAAFSGYTLDGTGTFAIDWRTGEKRYATRQDIENGVRVFQQMDLGTVVWPPTCASDAPAPSRALHEFLTALRAGSKHVMHELHHPAQVPYLINALQAILGSARAIKERKICSLCYCTIAPLVHEGAMCDAYIELGKSAVPILVLPMPACGTTGPASLFSNICLANAEALSAVVIFQLANPGSPLIFGGGSGSVDFKSGRFLSGTPEMVLQTGALGEMGRFYQLPNAAVGCVSDANEPGVDAVAEKMLTTLPLVLAGLDLIEGFGEIETSQTLVLEQIVVDNEIAHLCQRIREGINFERDYCADIAAVSPGGHFLGEENTRRAARSTEFYMPKLIGRHTYEKWLDLGKPNMCAKAREIVKGILEGPMVDPLPDDVSQQLDSILAAADRELAGKD
jgi:trimethylamine--corrinoid protein Co-methyltransferase